MNIIHINDHLTAFYVGRDAPATPAGPAKNWLQFDLDLGVCAYAFHYEGRALVFDTLPGPEYGRRMRAYLEDELGARRIIVILSHWHLDHIGGCEAFKDCDIMSSAQTRQFLAKNQAAIEAGELWGPPALPPLSLPYMSLLAPMPFRMGELSLEPLPFDVHTAGSLALYCPEDKILLVGDMLEDNIPCLNHPEAVPAHIDNLSAMTRLDVTAIYPGHGSPDKIARGGYGKDFITATADYMNHALDLCREQSLAPGRLKDWLAPWEERGVLEYHPVYEGVHTANVERMRDYYRMRPVPEVL